MTIPAAKDASAPLKTAPLTYRVVLLAEDDPVLRRSLSDFLSDEGFLVREAADVATIRRALAQGGPAAFVLDVNLADGNVSEVLAELVAREERVPIVLISAAAEAPELARQHRVQLVRKPLELDTLVEALLIPADERDDRATQC